MTSESLDPIFKNLNIVELASALAGPLAGTFFRELGAQVTKLEPLQGDATRHWRIREETPETEHSYYYCAANGNKNSKRLNLRQDVADLRELIESADIVLTNFTKDKALHLQLNYDAISDINPKVILANVIGFSEDEYRPAFDLLLQAECGLLSFSGYADRWPSRIPIPIADIIAAHQLKEAILCALLKRERSGLGSHIQISLYDSMLSALTQVASNYLMGNVVAQPSGMSHQSIAPYGDIFITKDHRQIVLAIGTDAQFRKLCTCLNDSSRLLDDRFSSNAKRVVNRSELQKILSREFLRCTLDEWCRIFTKNNIPAGPILHIDQVLSTPFAHRNIVSETMPDGSISKRMRQAVFI